MKNEIHDWDPGGARVDQVELGWNRVESAVNPDTPFTYFPQEKKKESTPARRKKNFASARLLFPSQLGLGPIGKDSGRTPAANVERHKNNARVDFFSSVTDHVCKNMFFVPSVIGKYNFISLDVAAGDLQFFPSVTENVCKKLTFSVRNR